MERTSKAICDIPLLLGHSGHSIVYDWSENWTLKAESFLANDLKVIYQLRVIQKSHELFSQSSDALIDSQIVSLAFCDCYSRPISFPIDSESHVLTYPYNFQIGGSMANDYLMMNSSTKVFGKIFQPSKEVFWHIFELFPAMFFFKL